ncbi:hypothetical protein Bca52824_046888 [Brassica carinata]|uniref:Uncharacterized protein n=2 Tax=Brassica TaxID=3705 RepID=A0A8X7RDT1_BRACI|nr:hypothetical protein Bca52824_046888 [Brassica carinata]
MKRLQDLLKVELREVRRDKRRQGDAEDEQTCSSIKRCRHKVLVIGSESIVRVARAFPLLCMLFLGTAEPRDVIVPPPLPRLTDVFTTTTGASPLFVCAVMGRETQGGVEDGESSKTAPTISRFVLTNRSLAGRTGL